MTTKFPSDIIYYSVISPKYDIDFDLLSEVRYKFFSENKRQKNKITKEIKGELYHYSYLLEENKPLKWKKMFKSKILERSIEDKNGYYKVLIQDLNKKVKKIMHFDNLHNWIKSEYIGDNAKIIFTKSVDGAIDVSEILSSGELLSYKIFPTKSNKETLHEKNTAVIICQTNYGDFYYCRENQLAHNLAVAPKERAEKRDLIGDADDSDILLCELNKNYGKTIETEKGEKFFYFGHMEGTSRDGYGKTVAQDGVTVFEGEYKSDKKNGVGVTRYRSGELCYAGNFRENKRHGLGISFQKERIQVSSWTENKVGTINSIFDNEGNLLFAGKIKDGIRNGAGVEYKADGSNFVVKTFKDGLFTGQCVLFDEEGRLSYSGELSERDGTKQGVGVEYNRDGTLKYKGSWKNDLYDGKGCLYFDDGRKIEGSFKNGKVNGFACEYDSKNVKIYEGNWKDNLYNEEGTKYLNNGNYLKGLFEAGQAKGVLLEFNSDGEILYKGNFNENAYYGKGSLYINGEKVYEGSFENNLYSGEGKIFEYGKCVYDGQFKNGFQEGFGTQFIDDEIKYIGNWKNDVYNGIGIYYEKYEPKYVGNFLNGKKHGRLNEIYKGAVIKECIFNDDELIYVKKYNYPTMNLVYAGNVRDGKCYGMGCRFNEYGEKEFEGIFANDVPMTGMRVFLKKIDDLPYCKELKDTEYEKLRFGPNYVIEKEIGSGLYSGLLDHGKPTGKGSILYQDHRYTGDFLKGVAKGHGTLYKNDGTELKGKFFESEVTGSSKIIFDSGVVYNYISDR